MKHILLSLAICLLASYTSISLALTNNGCIADCPSSSSCSTLCSDQADAFACISCKLNVASKNGLCQARCQLPVWSFPAVTPHAINNVLKQQGFTPTPSTNTAPTSKQQTPKAQQTTPSYTSKPQTQRRIYRTTAEPSQFTIHYN